MAATREMVRMAQNFKPHRVTLVPERRDELTTEGGLDVVLHAGNVEKIVRELLNSGVDVSIFVDPDLEQIRGCHRIGAPRVEINTGKYADSWRARPTATHELERITMAARGARKLGLSVFAGHGLTY